ncbi:MAG TPA: RNA-binding protein S4 [Rhodobacteraceae bacterium]|jgi:ribosome-associated heat shock protein Hsp15|nr:RNA-binding protein S4 [Paracoccaceae bacterium]
MADEPVKGRVDKWLWHARFFKTRGLASKLVSGGHLRLNGNRIAKASATVVAGDTLTFPQANRIRVIQIKALGSRRGPAPEAQALYLDLTPIEEAAPAKAQIERKGRPSKKDRRMARLLRGSYLE